MWDLIKAQPDSYFGILQTVRNLTHTVSFRVFQDEKFGNILHLKVSRNDLREGIPWDVLQEIKNEFAGTHTQAIEFYPPEKHLVSMAPVRHLWCFLDGEQLGFGYRFRATNLEELLGNTWETE